MKGPESMYPKDWPRCSCGDFALDGHITCGRAECDESGSRNERSQAYWTWNGRRYYNDHPAADDKTAD